MSEATLTAEETQAAAPATQASESTESELDLNEASALLDEIEGKETQGDAGTEAVETRSTEPEANDELAEAVKAAKEAAAEEARASQREADAKEQQERVERAQWQSQVEGINRAFGERASRIRATLEGIRDGTYELTPELTNAFLTEFNAHHAQSSIVTHKAYWDGTVAFAKELLPADSASEIEKGAKDGKYKNFGELQRAIIDAKVKEARTGHYTEAQVREREATAAYKALQKFQKDPDRYLSRTRTAVSRQGAMADSRGDDAKLLDPNTPMAEIDRILARRNGQ